MEIRKLNQDFSVCKVMDYSLVNMDAEYSFIGKQMKKNPWYVLLVMFRQMSLSVMMDGKVFVFKEF